MMRTLQRMLVSAFLPVFFFSLLFFVLILQLLDIFANLWRYLAHDATLLEIIHIAAIYTPKCISFSLPAAVLFAVSFTFGIMYKNNELIAILGSGISLYQLLIPFFLIGLLLSIGAFFFEEKIVIDTFKRKNELYRSVVNQTISMSNANVTVISGDIQTVYQVDYYDDRKQVINNVLILTRDSTGGFKRRIDAEWGEWNGENWILHDTRIYQRDEEGMSFWERRLFNEPELSEDPSTFRKSTRKVEEMNYHEAINLIRKLKKAGLPFREALTEYYKKYFFALSPLIVTLIAGGVGSRFKRNVLLMNLLTALVVSVLYYVLQMICLILAKSSYIPPLVGAGASFIIFLFTGIFLLKISRT